MASRLSLLFDRNMPIVWWENAYYLIGKWPRSALALKARAGRRANGREGRGGSGKNHCTERHSPGTPPAPGTTPEQGRCPVMGRPAAHIASTAGPPAPFPFTNAGHDPKNWHAEGNDIALKCSDSLKFHPGMKLWQILRTPPGALLNNLSFGGSCEEGLWCGLPPFSPAPPPDQGPRRPLQTFDYFTKHEPPQSPGGPGWPFACVAFPSYTASNPAPPPGLV